MPERRRQCSYLVDDVDCRDRLVHEASWLRSDLQRAPAFADVKRGSLRLLLSGPKSSAGRPMTTASSQGGG